MAEMAVQGLLLLLTLVVLNLPQQQELSLKHLLAETIFLHSLVLEPSLSNLFKGAI
jgi:hypothetical protein